MKNKFLVLAFALILLLDLASYAAAAGCKDNPNYSGGIGRWCSGKNYANCISYKDFCMWQGPISGGGCSALTTCAQLNADKCTKARGYSICLEDSNDFIMLSESLPYCNKADTNYDGAVDSADLALWQRNYAPIYYCGAADVNNDYKVNSADLALWQRNYNPRKTACIPASKMCDNYYSFSGIIYNDNIDIEINKINLVNPNFISFEMGEYSIEFYKDMQMLKKYKFNQYMFNVEGESFGYLFQYFNVPFPANKIKIKHNNQVIEESGLIESVYSYHFYAL